MQIDELRGELVTLADEIAPFEGDVGALHRRDRRRRIVGEALTGALALVVAIAVVVAINDRGNGKVHVSGKPSKEVPSAQITHIDLIVVPATAEVKAALDASALVDKYAFIRRGDRSSSSLLFVPNLGLCALQTSDGYAVDAVTPATNIRADLQRELAGRGTVYETSDNFGIDFEIFFQVGIAGEYPLAVLQNLQSDPDVLSVRDLTPIDAYAIFKKDFADQPALVQGTKPSDLPESLRVVLEPQRSIASVIRRYEHADGVDKVITSGSPRLFDPVAVRSAGGKLISPCTKP